MAPSGTVVWTVALFDGSVRRRTPSPPVLAITQVCPPGTISALIGEAKRYEANRPVEAIAVRHKKPRRVSRSVKPEPLPNRRHALCAVPFLLWPSGRTNGYADRWLFG